MGCIYSKDSNIHDFDDKEARKSSVRIIASLHGKHALEIAKSRKLLEPNNEIGKTRIIERPKNGLHKHTQQEKICGVVSAAKAEQVAAGWPSWLASVAAEAIHGWTPRSPDSYQKLNKIGQGTYSSVYRARDLTTNKIVAMKKVRFVNMDPESVRFMAREICILRKLDHPNVMKLEGLVTSRISGSLYLVFEYMEHDLAGLAASPKVKFTEPQIKCYARQMFLGLEHCHSRGVLHRDIKGSNLLVDNNGILKIADFGLATLFRHDQKQALTSHVVTLWYRAPELLLGATQYGVEIDMWSAGCILAELFAGKPIMPGRTEVEQMHKIFKLCGSPTEQYWAKTKFPHATSFKSQRPYKRRVADVFNYFPSSALAMVQGLLSIDPDLRGSASSALTSEFFTSDPLPCDPSSLPKYPPSKEFDAKLREEEATRRKVDNAKGHEVEYGQSNKSKVKKNHESSFHVELDRENVKNGYPRTCNVVIHPKGVTYASHEKVKDNNASRSIPASTSLSRQGSDLHSFTLDSSNQTSNNGSIGYVPKKNRIFCSGPIMHPGGNMDDMLKEHERQIQEAVRRSRVGKGKGKGKSNA